ncbi:YaeQ family protein [Wenzhouxiangella marina]|uniref:YaeQ family protein n=1 Tax=Wenzhouxiangella marina TaxID=1579979 RepID=A0A0K0XZV5_9GAMM|nr:YaeQ family protein [Wenzhouxiangella marina]AKS43187.1 YaeQ family protein [Wenzhouxiangella marina]MBB6087128.1 uncharacterized protein YaeQ [Wenzhouxiangella marina]
MALSATTYKMHLDLSDTDRGVYEELRHTVARHPSETEERLTARILAFGLFWDPRMHFGRGLSDVDEAALWSRNLEGQIEHWVEVGRPDADRLKRCSNRTDRLTLLAYGNQDVWAAQVLPKVANLDKLAIASLPQAPMNELAVDLPRSIHWGLMITDDVLYVSDGDRQVEIALSWLKRSG